jgi:hypothetical protein
MLWQHRDCERERERERATERENRARTVLSGEYERNNLGGRGGGSSEEAVEEFCIINQERNRRQPQLKLLSCQEYSYSCKHKKHTEFGSKGKDAHAS